MAFGFSKKKTTKEDKVEEQIPPIIESPKDIPTDRILDMRQRGMSNNQINVTLQREGYSPSQVFDAMNQADLSQPAPQSPYPQEQMEYPQTQQPYEQPKEKIEELVEVIIDEKWNELVKDISKIIEWKDKIERKVEDLNKNISDLKINFDSLKKNILSKITQYDKGISNVGTSIKAMETAFSKILPTFTSNVSELSRITKKLKR